MTEYTHPKAEDRFCNCGAGHGSLEGHTDWCAWLGIKPALDALTEVMNWYTPPNDSKPFPVSQVAEALAKIEGAALPAHPLRVGRRG